MTNIEDKMKLFSKIIYEKIQKENEKKIKDFKIQKEEILRKKELKIREVENEVLKDIKKKANIKYAEMVSKEKMNSRQDVLKVKGNFIEETIKNVEKKLRGFCICEEYKKYLFDGLRKTLSNMEKGSYNIYLLSRDIEKFKKELNIEVKRYKNLNITIQKNDEDIIGGFLIKDRDNRFRIDNTLISKLLDNRQYIGLKVIDVME